MSTLDSPSRPFEIEHPFLVCPENRFAYAAAFGIAAQPELARGMIVTVFGPTGTGKTHLIREAARNYARQNAAARVAQTTGRELSELIATRIHQRAVEQLRDDYARVNLLLCDGLDEIPENRPIQHHVVALLDELTSNGGMVLLASPKPPGELRHLSPRLVNRCHEGVLAEVAVPDAANRRKLLEHFASAYRISVPAAVHAELAHLFEVSGRELLSLVKRLYEFGRITKRPISVELLEEMLSGEAVAASVPLSRIAQAVAGEFGISLQEMQSGSRARRSLVSRQTAMLLAREVSGVPLSEIGDYFGGRNHSTVVHACQRASQLIEIDQEVASVVAKIRQLLAAKPRRPRRKPRDRMSTSIVRAG